MSFQLFAAISLFAVVLDGLIAANCLRKNSASARYLGLTLVAAGVVCLAYLGSLVFSENKLLMSLSSSISFAGIDVMLLLLLYYTMEFTEYTHQPKNLLLRKVLCVFAVFDVAVLLSNPLTGWALDYSFVASGVAHWHYEPLLLFDIHLGFCYLIIGLVALCLVYKAVEVPSVYRGRYLQTLGGVLLVVAINALFLFLPDTSMLDYSLLLYGVIGWFLYWNEFLYSNKPMLDQARAIILEEMGRPVVLFDHQGRYVMSNQLARSIFSGVVPTRDYWLETFVAECGFGEGFPGTGDADSRTWLYSTGGRSVSYRVDYRILRDRKGRLLGTLFVFTDNTLEVDLLTGFNADALFQRTFRNEFGSAEAPVYVLVFDLNSLSDINARFGRQTGDKALRFLAHCMRGNLPANTYFVRCADAVLGAVVHGGEEAALRECADAIEREVAARQGEPGQLSLQYVLLSSAGGMNVVRLMDQAIDAMRARKLLDGRSSHSSLMDSLVQTQRESDGETEAHVKRTRAMGEKLGKRLGFTDMQQVHLALLCLLHDIGKVGIPLEILNKPGRLTDVERQVMSTHTVKGYQIARASQELSGIAECILYHHENWDGSGYPEGLSGTDIPLLSRVISVVDTFDAMTHDRPYRKGRTVRQACAELKACAGTQFDPAIVEEFVAMLDQDGLLDARIEAVPANADYPPTLAGQQHNAAGQVSTVSSMASEGPDTMAVGRVAHARYLIDAEDHILEVDEGFTRLTGYSAQEAQGLCQKDLIPSEDWEEYARYVGAVLKRSDEVYLEHRVKTKDGSARQVLCFGRRYFDPAVREGRSEILVTDLDALLKDA